MSRYLTEGDCCPKCIRGMLVIQPPNKDDGICYLICQDCHYDATDDESIISDVQEKVKKGVSP